MSPRGLCLFSCIRFHGRTLYTNVNQLNPVYVRENFWKPEQKINYSCFNRNGECILSIDALFILLVTQTVITSCTLGTRQ